MDVLLVIISMLAILTMIVIAMTTVVIMMPGYHSFYCYNMNVILSHSLSYSPQQQNEPTRGRTKTRARRVKANASPGLPPNAPPSVRADSVVWVPLAKKGLWHCSIAKPTGVIKLVAPIVVILN